MILRPSYVNAVKPYINQPLIKILTGIRRSGKSTILKMITDDLKQSGIKDERIICYKLDDFEFTDTSAKELYERIQKELSATEKTYLFLDEIQEISDWEKLVNNLMQNGNVDIYITGSNSRMLSSEIST
ncbi:MAG: AAA family ATPase, partial [Oscillospiraceae bacterium]|nr:AAA family ATPase [Oscillospiraceae bacterium]